MKCPRFSLAETRGISTLLPIGVVHPLVPRLIQMMSQLQHAPDVLMLRLSRLDATLSKLVQWGVENGHDPSTLALKTRLRVACTVLNSFAQRRAAFEMASRANHILVKLLEHSENVAYDESAFLLRVAYNSMQALQMPGSVVERQLPTYNVLQALLQGGAKAMRTKAFQSSEGYAVLPTTQVDEDDPT